MINLDSAEISFCQQRSVWSKLWFFHSRSGGANGKECRRLSTMQETWVRPLDWEDPLEKGMAMHSSVLAWRRPWTEEPGELESTTE